MGRGKKQRRESQEAPESVPHRNTPPPHGQWVPLATLGGVAVVFALTLASARAIVRIDEGLHGRLEQIETRIAQLATKVDRLPAQGQSRRGLDPNKIYKVKTSGSPAKGPADAPVTIAEFSDFQ